MAKGPAAAGRGLSVSSGPGPRARAAQLMVKSKRILVPRPPNKFKKKKSEFVGISFSTRDGNWLAQIKPNKESRQKTLGCFKDPVLAAKAYDAAAVLHRGEAAKVNFPADFKVKYGQAQKGLAKGGGGGTSKM